MPMPDAIRRHDKRQQETWRDWMPEEAAEPDVLLTREEVLGQLQAMRIEVSSDALQGWQRHGIIPRPIRGQHNGVPAALYPPWMPTLLATLRQLQDDGLPLKEIARHLRKRYDRRAAPSGEAPPPSA
jgi:hypothetical protein